MAVTFINCFEVPAGSEDDFLGRWLEVNAYMREKEGYLEHRLFRAVGPDARFRFVNIAQWTSPQALADGHDEGFRALVADPAWSEYPSSPALFELVHAGAVEEVSVRGS